MPPLIVAALAGVGLYAGYKWLVNETKQAEENLRRAAESLDPDHSAQMSGKKSAQNKRKSVNNLKGVELIKDPKTGVYRPNSNH